MKEVGIKWSDMEQPQRNSIIELKMWLHQMWSNHGIKNYYSLYQWLVDIPNEDTVLSASDLSTLTELWEIYTLYKKENGSTEHNN